MAVEEEITEEQAHDALQQLLPQEYESEPESIYADQEPSDEVSAEPEESEEGEIVAQEDDLESLRTRYQELEAQSKASVEANESRFQAVQQRSAENERILRERYLRKSTVLDRARSTLKAAQSSEGVSEEDVSRIIGEIDGTVNPASPSYVAPQQYSDTAEDQSLMVNSFLSQKGMGKSEEEEFGRWMQTEAPTVMSEAEQAIAGQSLPGFLYLAHARWQQGVREKEKELKRSDAVGAVKSVQRTQREAARAASGSPSSPKKQPAGSRTAADATKLTPDDISTLMRQSVTQYK